MLEAKLKLVAAKNSALRSDVSPPLCPARPPPTYCPGAEWIFQPPAEQ